MRSPNATARSGLWLGVFILTYLVAAIVAGFKWGIEAFLWVMLVGPLVEACITVATWIKTEREKGRARK